MSRLQRDYRRLRIAALLLSFCFLVLGCLKLIGWATGLTEEQFYTQHPFGWYLVVALGLSLMAGLLYAVKKAIDINPNIQLRSKSDEEIRIILDDSGYAPWHSAAEHILIQRAEKRG